MLFISIVGDLLERSLWEVDLHSLDNVYIYVWWIFMCCAVRCWWVNMPGGLVYC